MSNNKSSMIQTPSTIRILINGAPLDPYEQIRGEGRILSNIGYGLKELGYTVDFQNTNTSTNYTKYDYELTWFKFLNTTKAKQIAMVTYENEVNTNIHTCDRINNKYVTPFKGLLKYLSDAYGGEVLYLPPLFPISIYQKSFKSFKYDINNTLRIFLFVSSWDKYLYAVPESITVLKQLSEHYRNKNHKIFLTVQTDSIETTREILPLLENLADTYKYINKINYYEYLNLIEQNDIFIIRGSSAHSTSGMYDIISLGKPIIYIAWEHRGYTHNIGKIRNPLHTSEQVIFMGDRPEDITNKVNTFLENPQKWYNNYRDTIQDSDFNNWREYALKIFR